MNLEIVKFNSLPPPNQHEVAGLVANYTQGLSGEVPQMLPVSPVDIQQKFAGFVALSDGVFAGYMAAAQPEKWAGKNMAEMGTLWVPKEHRRLGIARYLVSSLGKDLIEADIVPYGFCNPLSLPIFLEAGFELADTEAVPSSALSLCAACPNKPTKGCCDTIVVMEPAR